MGPVSYTHLDVYKRQVLTSVLAAFDSLETPVFLARLGGDEFVVIVRHPHARATAVRIAMAICAALEVPIAYDTLEFIATPSLSLIHISPSSDSAAATGETS